MQNEDNSSKETINRDSKATDTSKLETPKRPKIRSIQESDTRKVRRMIDLDE